MRLKKKIVQYSKYDTKVSILWFLKTYKTQFVKSNSQAKNWKEIKNHQFFINGGQHIIVATLVSLKGLNLFFDLIRFLISCPIFNTTKKIWTNMKWESPSSC
jgi:hypothetical protein